MKITTCGYSEYTFDEAWKFIFDVEDVDEKYLEQAKEIDGDEFDKCCFDLEVWYHEDTKTIREPVDLVYINFDGGAEFFDYELTDEQKEYLLEQIRKEIDYA